MKLMLTANLIIWSFVLVAIQELVNQPRPRVLLTIAVLLVTIISSEAITWVHKKLSIHPKAIDPKELQEV